MSMPTILVTGGAGYIGSTIALAYAQKGYQVIILDDEGVSKHTEHASLPSGHMNAGNVATFSTYIVGDYANVSLLEAIFTNHIITAVVHCAAFIDVGQSVREPLAYYQNNVAKTVTLLQTMVQHGVKNIVFSSSCAVYGQPQWLPLTEDHPKSPMSPYGATKLMIEQMLHDVHRAHDVQFVALRYFNAAGAVPEDNLGERHEPETHIIPLLLRAVHEQKPFAVFGSDYATIDGTCVRDFLHVRDIASAHVQAVEYLSAGGNSDCFNLGTGHGFSVKEMIAAVMSITGKHIDVVMMPRRAGDPDQLIADPCRAQQLLGWRAIYSDIQTIIKSADDFYKMQTRVAMPSRRLQERSNLQ
jgi:UDP-glucose 4-epimerase